MLAVGGAFQVTRLIEGGYRGVVLDNILRRAFPDARTQSVQALRRYGRRVADATAAGYSAPGFAVIQPPTGAGNPGLAPGIWYETRVQAINRLGQRVEFRYPLRVGEALQKADLYAQVRANVLAGEGMGLAPSPPQPHPITTVLNVRLILVERGR